MAVRTLIRVVAVVQSGRRAICGVRVVPRERAGECGTNGSFFEMPHNWRDGACACVRASDIDRCTRARCQ
jgi:hypothetical protein